MKIIQYTQQSDVRNPIDQPRVSAEALSTGRGLAALGQGIDDAIEGTQKYLALKDQKAEQDEISQTNVKLSEANALFNKEWQETLRTSDGSDPDLSKNFIARYDEYMTEVYGGLKTKGGKQYFQENNARLRAGLEKSSYSGQAELAGQKAKLDFSKALSFSSSALLDNPTGFQYAKEQQDGYIRGLVAAGRISELDGQALMLEKDRELATSAIRGTAKLNPALARKELESGAWDQYLDARSKEVLFGAVEREERSAEIDRERMQAAQEKAMKARQTEAYDQMMDKWVDGKLTARDVSDSILDPREQRVLINMIKREKKAPRTLKSNPSKVAKMYERVVILPDGHPAKIANESQLDDLFMRGHISALDHKEARALLKKSQTEEGKLENKYKAAAMEMGKKMVYGKSAREAEMYRGFQQSYEKAFAAGIRAGKSPEELSSPEFVAQVARPFKLSPQQKLQDKATRIVQTKKKVDEQEAAAKKNGEKPKTKFELMQEALRKRGL